MRDVVDPSRGSSYDEDPADLYEHAPCGYLSVTGDGRIVKVNATFLEWTGFRREQLLGGRRFFDLLTVGGRIFCETHFLPLLRMQGFVREIAFDIVRQDGSRVPMLVNAMQRTQPDGIVVIRITVFDATDRRRYERELLLARNQAQEAAQARSHLIAMISHDVRAPLGAIATAAELLAKMTPTPQQMRYIRVVQSSASHAMSVLSNTLDLSRLEAGRNALRERKFDLRQLVQDVVSAGRVAAARKPELSVTASIDTAIPERLLGDAGKIGQVLTNLVTNAVKFTERGLVSVIVAAREVTADAASIEVIVSDTGIGIPADRLPHIFDEFTQASDEIAEKYGGTGLGLAISRKLLLLYNAELSVTSTVGQGTTFSFVLTLRLPS